MIRKLMQKLSLVLVSGFVLASLAPALPAHALFEGAVNEACQGTQLGDNDTTSCDNKQAGNKVNSTLATAINIFSLVVGIIAVIMVMIGGLKYITSAGDSNSVNNAKNTILYAVIGLVIVVLAQVIVRFVLQKST